ncbi:DNA-binding protein [Salmonella enterica subsp. enterica serovar Montevideo]|nr:DNA-binding protein [Salmonella enterica subsp. enterica serovar Montevideo]
MSRNYTPAQKAEIQKRLTELVRTHGRMTFGELRKITRLTIFTARHYLENAESCGDLYQAGRSGIFPSVQAFLLWKQKREDARITRFLKTPEGVVSSYDRTRNVICTECRNSVTMQRVLAFYPGHYREAKSA